VLLGERAASRQLPGHKFRARRYGVRTAGLDGGGRGCDRFGGCGCGGAGGAHGTDGALQAVRTSVSPNCGVTPAVLAQFRHAGRRSMLD